MLTKILSVKYKLYKTIDPKLKNEINDCLRDKIKKYNEYKESATKPDI